MIDVETGALTLDSEQIGPYFTLPQFRRSLIAQRAQGVTGGPGWSNFYIGQYALYGATVAVLLFFEGERLDSINVSLVTDHPGDDWSEDAALAAKARHDAWLAEKVGAPPYGYSWGVIESAYDPRSVSSSIVVRYTANH